jgi:hypothetical protein
MVLHGDTLIVAKVPVGRGISWAQSAYEVLRRRATGWRVEWTALAEEHAAPDSTLPTGPYAISGCLIVRRDGLLIYDVFGNNDAGQQALYGDTLARAPGVYRWSSADGRFTYVAALTDAEKRSCAGQP